MSKGTSASLDVSNETKIVFVCITVQYIQTVQTPKSKNSIFGRISPISPPIFGQIWPKLSKGTFASLDLSNETKIAFVRISVQKIQPVQESDDGRTDGHPKSIGPKSVGLGPNKPKMVQRRSARFVMEDHQRHSSVTSMLSNLKWIPSNSGEPKQRQH